MWIGLRVNGVLEYIKKFHKDCFDYEDYDSILDDFDTSDFICIGADFELVRIEVKEIDHINP